MERRLFGIFTGWQLTAFGCVALLAPGALYAAVTFTPVGIVDPNTGTKSFVDAGRRLYVYDPVASLRNNPADFVNVEYDVPGQSGGVQCTQIYQIPPGKALVVTSLSGTVFNVSGSGEVGFFLDYRANCAQPDAVGFNQSTVGATPFAIDLGSGVAVAAGSSLFTFTANASSAGFVRGYLVPAASVPAAGSPEALAANPGPTQPARRNSR